ncbi:MAG: outer membrane beta-barrel protein [Minicystis sp.]
MSRFAVALGSLALASFFSAPAFAQNLGAGVNVTVPGVSANGQITVGIPQFGAPTPAPTYQDPAPSYPAPRPAVRYYEPAPRPMHVRPRQPNWGAEKLGLDLRIDGAAGFGQGAYGNAYGMGGGGIGLRYRAMPHLGFEAGIDLLGGRDYNASKRFEVAGSAGALVFFNPRSRAQVYLSGGLLLDHARELDGAGYTLRSTDATYNHFGGYAGLGLEVFLTRHISFHVDGKGILRQKIGGNTGAPEFVEIGTGRTTNTSGGFVGSAGLVLYF